MLRDSVFVARAPHAHVRARAHIHRASHPSRQYIYLASAAFRDPHTQREAESLVSLRPLTARKPVLLLRVITIFDDISEVLESFYRQE